MKKRIWKFAAVSAGILAADAVVLRCLLNLTLGRKCMLYRANPNRGVPYQEEIQEEIKWVEQQNVRMVSVKSFDGLKLTGHLLEPETPKRILVVFHGWRSSWKRDFGACTRAMYEEGCSLLLADQRAQGESEGNYMGMGVLEKKDCGVWLRWVQEHNEQKLPVYLYGISMGAATVLMAAGGELPACVKGVIADCGFSSPYDMVMEFGRKHFRLFGNSMMRRLNWLCRRYAGFDLKEDSAEEAAGRCKVPILLIHGKADTFVPYEMTVRIYEACRAEKDLLLVDGADHCMSYLKDKDHYMEAVRRLFERSAVKAGQEG